MQKHGIYFSRTQFLNSENDLKIAGQTARYTLQSGKSVLNFFISWYENTLYSVFYTAFRCFFQQDFFLGS